MTPGGTHERRLGAGKHRSTAASCLDTSIAGCCQLDSALVPKVVGGGSRPTSAGACNSVLRQRRLWTHPWRVRHRLSRLGRDRKGQDAVAVVLLPGVRPTILAC